ncbi:MAG: hypothetical protein HOV80_17790 [Polyangiaceae bacterium]|nr:hypothetical protein [Polyangiaceae bacterium]
MITVTITGADDECPIHALADVSEQYPFVEWGALISESRIGTPRYPSKRWLDALVASGLTAAGHLCGRTSRETMAGSPEWITRFPFRRFQINGFNRHAVSGRFFRLALQDDAPEYIFQCRSEADAREDGVLASSYRRWSVLFDASGGQGVRPARWPHFPRGCEPSRVGFAGGITPANVEDVVQELLAVRRPPFWIDMESGVRSPFDDGGDHFDWDKVEEVLEKVDRINNRLVLPAVSCSDFAPGVAR